MNQYHKSTGMQGQRPGKEESGYGITRTLTIWLSLRSNGGGGDDCCRDHSPKQGQSRSRIAGSHGIVNTEEVVRKRASEVVPIGAGRETKKQIEEEGIK
jgi:hypothetical protein